MSMNSVSDEAPNASELLAAALGYSRRGWSVFTVKEKKPKGLRHWTPFQTRLPTEADLRRWCNGKGVTGLAVVCGEVSGGLTIRDFDQLEAYNHWAAQWPELARTLPTVETARGRHVYFSSAYRGVVKYADGELRGSGCYCVLPPSLHPSGMRYRWLIPLPDGALPMLDPFAVGLDGVAKNVELPGSDATYVVPQKNIPYDYITSNTYITSITPSALVLCHSVNDDEVEKAIAATLPTAQKQRNDHVFQFARHLKAIPRLYDAPTIALRTIVQEWHRRALPVIGTKSFVATWADFCQAWPKVKFPAGCEPMTIFVAKANKAQPPPEAARFDNDPQAVQLMKICRELQRSKPGEHFFMGCRTAGRLIGVSHTAASALLTMLCVERLLRVEVECTTIKARRYSYLGEL